MDRRIDMAVALAFMALGLFIIWQATGIRTGVPRDPIGPRAAIYVCGGALVLGGAWLILRHALAFRRGLGRWVSDEGSADLEGVPAHFGRAAAVMAICFAYAALFVPLGYLLATPPFIVAMLGVLGQRRWARNALVA